MDEPTSRRGHGRSTTQQVSLKGNGQQPKDSRGEDVKRTLLGDNNHIEVRGLRRVYGTGEAAFEAVRGIDLDVEHAGLPESSRETGFVSIGDQVRG